MHVVKMWWASNMLPMSPPAKRAIRAKLEPFWVSQQGSLSQAPAYLSLKDI